MRISTEMTTNSRLAYRSEVLTVEIIASAELELNLNSMNTLTANGFFVQKIDKTHSRCYTTILTTIVDSAVESSSLP